MDRVGIVLLLTGLAFIAACSVSGHVNNRSTLPPIDGGWPVDAGDGDGAWKPNTGTGDGGVTVPLFSPCTASVPSSVLPVTDPGARWVADSENFAGLDFMGYLDGPRHEMRSQESPGLAFFEGGGDYVLRALDPKTDRYFTVAGGARGYLDGPFSRARFGGWGYGGGLVTACAPDGTLYIAETTLNVVRRLDFAKQEVTTVISNPGAVGLGNFYDLVIDSKGKIYFLGDFTYTGIGLAVTDLQGNVQQPTVGPLGGQHPDHGFSMALDEKNNRLYAANRCTGAWYVWYWDLANGGAFVGVLPIPDPTDPSTRPRDVAGPFKGAHLWCPGGIGFGPDDPDYRYLYYGGGDYPSFWRLDLQAQMIDTFAPADAGETPSPGDMAFNQPPSELQWESIGTWGAFPIWGNQNNDILISVPIAPSLMHFRRVQ